MRIVKEQAVAALRREMGALEQQARHCQRQADKFSDIRFEGLAGASVTAAEQKMRMQASVARAHQRLCQTLKVADGQNVGLVQGLPTTSPGVLDTDEAQDRIDQAREHIRLLERNRQVAVDRARAANRSMAACPGAPLVDIGALRRQYDVLIQSQRIIIKRNQLILERAQEYERASTDLYRSVDASYLAQAHESVRCYLSGGTWGSTAWVGSLALARAVDAHLGELAAPKDDVVRQFAEGRLKYHDDVLHGSTTTTRGDRVLVASGEVLGLDLSIKPYSESGKKVGEDEDKTALGAKAEASLSIAKGSVKERAGIVEASASGSVLTGAVSGALGCAMPSEEGYVPSLTAKVSSSASVLSGNMGVQVGDVDYNAHTKLSGTVLAAEAEAGVSFGDSGAEVKVGAEAYVAKGTISGGVTFLGVAVDVSLEAKAGGAGAKAAAGASLTSVEGELGLGLVVGLSAKVKVDWSGLLGACDRLARSVESWWDDVTRRKEENDV